MAQGIDIKIGSSFDAAGITEANKSLAKLAQDVGSANQQLRQATLKAAADINSYAEAADKACRAMGGGYKDASQFVKDAMGEYLNASKSVKQASGAFDDFNAVMRRAAEAVDKRNANIKQAAEVSQVLEKKQRELAAITDTSSEAYKRASRNVEILKQALASLGVKASGVNKPVEAVPSRWRTALSSATGHVKGFASAVGRNLMNIQAGFQMAARAVQTFVSVMSKGMEFERMTVQFKSLTGSMELARAHMKDLQDLGRTPPFSLEQFAAASQAMLKMTGGMAGFKKEMKIVGDLAAATGNDIATVGRAFGLAYQVIRDGQDFGRAGQQLYSLGIMTKKQVAEFAELSKAGTDNAAVWEKLQDVFARYEGAMAETENTTKGIVEAIQGEATVAMTEFSAAVADAATPALGGLLAYLKRINEDGTIEDWADRASTAISDLIENVKALREELNDIPSGEGKDVFSKSTKSNIGTFLGNTWAGLGSIGAGFMESMKGGSFGDAQLAYMALHGYGSEADRAARELSKSKNEKGEWTGDIDIRDADAAQRKIDREIAANEKKRKREEQAAAEAEAQKRQEQDLARAQQERDNKERAKNYNAYLESGSSDTFEQWLKAKREADAKQLSADKKAFAEYQRKAGIDTDITIDDIDEADDAFKAWRDNEHKKVAQERADNQKTAELKQQTEVSAANEASRIRIENAREELKATQDAASSQQSAASNAQTEFDRAFAMYRSEDKGAAQIAEERDYAADYKQLKKDAARYGGKWRIDELSNLIAAGDTQGQAAKLEEWRKSKSFTPEVESMVRAAAADDAKTTAEDELRKIAKNTESLSNKLDELLQVK